MGRGYVPRSWKLRKHWRRPRTGDGVARCCLCSCQAAMLTGTPSTYAPCACASCLTCSQCLYSNVGWCCRYVVFVCSFIVATNVGAIGQRDCIRKRFFHPQALTDLQPQLIQAFACSRDVRSGYVFLWLADWICTPMWLRGLIGLFGPFIVGIRLVVAWQWYRFYSLTGSQPVDTRENHAAGTRFRYNATAIATEIAGWLRARLRTRSLTCIRAPKYSMKCASTFTNAHKHTYLAWKSMQSQIWKHIFAGRLLVACAESVWAIHRDGARSICVIFVVLFILALACVGQNIGLLIILWPTEIFWSGECVYQGLCMSFCFVPVHILHAIKIQNNIWFMHSF